MVIVQFRGHLVRQYRACVFDSLGLGITCVISCTMCTRHPDLVSFAIPIFYILICIYLSPLIFNFKSADHNGASILVS